MDRFAVVSALWAAVAGSLLTAGVDLSASGMADIPHRWPLIFVGSVLLGASIPAGTTAVATRRR